MAYGPTQANTVTPGPATATNGSAAVGAIFASLSQQSKGIQTVPVQNSAKAARQAARQSAVQRRNDAAAARIKAHSDLVAARAAAQAQKKQDRQNARLAKLYPAGGSSTDGSVLGTSYQQNYGGSSVLQPNQFAQGGWTGGTSGTNDSGGIALGGDLTSDANMPTQTTAEAVKSTKLTTTEYVAIGVVALVVVFYIIKHHG